MIKFILMMKPLRLSSSASTLILLRPPFSPLPSPFFVPTPNTKIVVNMYSQRSSSARCVPRSICSTPVFNPGEVHVIMGPMFAGKTTTLLRRIQSEIDTGSFQVSLKEVFKSMCYSGNVVEATSLLWRCGVEMNHETYSLMLQECIHGKQYNCAKRVHCQMVILGHSCNSYLHNKLLILYARLGDLRTARVIFANLSDRSLISWNSIISGCVQNGSPKEGLKFYMGMRKGGLNPDQYTFACIFRACATLAEMAFGKVAHGLITKLYLCENVIVSSSLVDMYFKCSDVESARRVFDDIINRNVITWTVLISGFGFHGKVVDVLEYFYRMLHEGYMPNHVTFLVAITACSHAGMMEKGWEIFTSMESKYGIKPEKEHYSAIVDLLGRAGKLQEAYQLTLSSPFKEHSVVWGSLLGACRVHGDMQMLNQVANHYFSLDSRNAGKHVIFANACANFGHWKKVACVWEGMKKSGIAKEPACSKILIKGKEHVFHTADRFHERSDEIYKIIHELKRNLMSTQHSV